MSSLARISISTTGLVLQSHLYQVKSRCKMSSRKQGLTERFSASMKTPLTTLRRRTLIKTAQGSQARESLMETWRTLTALSKFKKLTTNMVKLKLMKALYTLKVLKLKLKRTRELLLKIRSSF